MSPSTGGGAAFKRLPQVARGAGALLVISVSTIVLTLLACVLAVFKLLAPEGAVREWFRRILARIAELWIGINNTMLGRYRQPVWDIELPAGLSRQGCYLVNCNHQSWVDILVLQRCFNRRLPLLRFFLKSELFWVPFLGVAWWALDFPYMRRYSKAELERRPELRGRDLENARRACEKFRNIPVAMMNFPEGTRFSPEKRDRYNSPYRNLLVPRLGGMGQVLYALGSELDALIDVTIVYPGRSTGQPAPTFWQLLSGQLLRITVRAEWVEIPASLRGRDFRRDESFRKELEEWMQELWSRKDRLIQTLESR